MFSSNLQASSSSSFSCHFFFNSTQDQNSYYQREIQQLQHHQEVNNLASHGGSHDLENESDNGLKLSLWKKEEDRNENQIQNNSVKWMSSKMRLMQKMKNSDQMGAKITTIPTQKFEEEDEKQPSSSVETYNCSYSSSNNSNNIPIRVCADCNTTKTPLWRSGPRGPKSLCNACGIRQRKARRAMLAAATANGTVLATETISMKAKVQNKEKRSNNIGAQYKKRTKLATSSPSRKKLCFEDFLINLRKNLAFHQVFSQDEKDAAILLMAISCGLVHG